jgi:hypothetical protein
LFDGFGSFVQAACGLLIEPIATAWNLRQKLWKKLQGSSAGGGGLIPKECP